jgi:quinol monooxygenase YgiN
VGAFVLTAQLHIKPRCVGKLMPASQVNASAARKMKPGCRRFDVPFDPQDTTKVMLHEVYDDAAAFEAYRQTPPFKHYFATALGWLESRESTFWRREHGT